VVLRALHTPGAFTGASFSAWTETGGTTCTYIIPPDRLHRSPNYSSHLRALLQYGQFPPRRFALLIRLTTPAAYLFLRQHLRRERSRGQSL